MKYQAPTGSVDPNAGYIGKNPALGQQGSKVPPKAIEQHQRELDHLIFYSGQTPSDADLEQVRKAIQLIASGNADTRSWRTVTGGPLTVAPGSPVTGDEYLVADGPSGAFAGQARKLATKTSTGWSFTTPTLGRVFRIAETSSYFQLLTAGWVAWNFDSVYMRKDASDTVSLSNAVHEFQNVRIGQNSAAGYSRNLSWRQNGDANDRLIQFLAGGIMFHQVINPASGAFIRRNYSLTDSGLITVDGPAAGFTANLRDNAAKNLVLYGNANTLYLAAGGAGGGDRMALAHDASSQLLWRSGGWKQITTEDRSLIAGAGIKLNGTAGATLDLSANRTISFDETVLDDFSAIRQSKVSSSAGFFSVPASTASFTPSNITYPSNSGGVEIASMTFTPKKADSILDFDLFGHMCGVTAASYAVCLALFQDGNTTPLVMIHDSVVGNSIISCSAKRSEAAGSTAGRTYRLRAYTNTYDALVNGYSGAAIGNGRISTGFSVRELKP